MVEEQQKSPSSFRLCLHETLHHQLYDDDLLSHKGEQRKCTHMIQARAGGHSSDSFPMEVTSKLRPRGRAGVRAVAGHEKSPGQWEPAVQRPSDKGAWWLWGSHAEGTGREAGEIRPSLIGKAHCQPSPLPFRNQRGLTHHTIDPFGCVESPGEFQPCLWSLLSTGGWDSGWSLVKQGVRQKLPGLEESRVRAGWVQSGSAREAKGSCETQRAGGAGAENKAKRARG